jgi:hypothetical protein
MHEALSLCEPMEFSVRRSRDKSNDSYQYTPVVLSKEVDEWDLNGRGDDRPSDNNLTLISSKSLSAVSPTSSRKKIITPRIYIY